MAEARILQVFLAKLTAAIDLATGSNPAMFSAQLIANQLLTMLAANSIVKVASNPPSTIINELVMNAIGQVQKAKDQEAERLFGLFLNILRELEVEDLAIEIEERYRRDRQEADGQEADGQEADGQEANIRANNPMGKFCIKKSTI